MRPDFWWPFAGENEFKTSLLGLQFFSNCNFSYAFGAIFAWLCKLKTSQITAVSIETAFQNGGIAFVLLKISLPPPYGDMAAVAPVSQLMLTGLPLWFILGLWKIYQRCCFAKKTLDSDEEPKSEAEKTEMLTRLSTLPDTDV